MTSRALVLGGGGVSGIAWELGVLFGLHQGNALFHDADLVVGTSAGAAVGAQITSGAAIDVLYQRQFEPVAKSKERMVAFNGAALGRAVAEARKGAKSPAEARAKIGAMALREKTVTEEERMETILARLPKKAWPTRPLLIPAINAHTGEAVVFDRNSGVPLAVAVAASCAVPGIWPPVTIDDERFIDGGIRSNANADLAAGMDRVLIITPSTNTTAAQGLRRQVASLQEVSEVSLITADKASAVAMGKNPLDPAFRPSAAEAGFAVGSAMADQIGVEFG